jgi:hypothetical protein
MPTRSHDRARRAAPHHRPWQPLPQCADGPGGPGTAGLRGHCRPAAPRLLLHPSEKGLITQKHLPGPLRPGRGPADPVRHELRKRIDPSTHGLSILERPGSLDRRKKALARYLVDPEQFATHRFFRQGAGFDFDGWRGTAIMTVVCLHKPTICRGRNPFKRPLTIRPGAGNRICFAHAWKTRSTRDIRSCGGFSPCPGRP